MPIESTPEELLEKAEARIASLKKEIAGLVKVKRLLIAGEFITEEKWDEAERLLWTD